MVLIWGILDNLSVELLRDLVPSILILGLPIKSWQYNNKRERYEMH